MATTIRDHRRLLEALYREYEERFPHSKMAHAQARRFLVDGVSHGARLFEPYPFYTASAQGACVTDLDGNEIVDFWQGHYANILGHNPPIVREALAAQLDRGWGLQTGLPEETQARFSAALAEATGAERVRLTTAGTLATMYAIMLARAFTGRDLVLKVAGGWHGAHPLGLKGVSRTDAGFAQVDSLGVPRTTEEEILVTRFNDVERLHQVFRSSGDRIACFIFEPCPGRAGFTPATAEFMRAARVLTHRHGALLILDEIITGFRYCAGGIQRLYGVEPDLTTFGKIIGGGMPLSAVVGRADVMELVSNKAKKRVWFNGGTFSAHPLALSAGVTLIEHLRQHEVEIYPALAERADRLREGVEKVFADRGILARCTGHGNGVIRGGSLSGVYFPLRDDLCPTSPEDLWDPRLCDVTLPEGALKLGVLLSNVHVVHGLGALSHSHTDEHLERVFEACDAFARRLLAE